VGSWKWAAWLISAVVAAFFRGQARSVPECGSIAAAPMGASPNGQHPTAEARSLIQANDFVLWVVCGCALFLFFFRQWLIY